MDHQGQTRAREAVAERMRDLDGMSYRDLSTSAGISTNTIGRFLRGESWPRANQLAAIERALRWPSGAITRIADGRPIPSVDTSRRIAADGDEVSTLSQPSELSSIVVLMPDGWRDGLTDLEAAEIEIEAKRAALRLARELRDSRARREEAAQ